MRNLLLIFAIIITSCDSSVKKVTTIKDNLLQQDTIVVEEPKEPEIIIDSQMTFEEAIAGSKAPQNIIDELVLVDIEYYSTDNKLHQGQLLINRSIENDITAIFDSIKVWHFPVVQAVPIVVFDWDDDRSMAANNTSSFCFRVVLGGKKLSNHAKGKAIDINPFFNPMIWKSSGKNPRSIPEGAQYDTNIPGTLYREHPVVCEFIKRKFAWGGSFSKYYDYHHFQKN